MHFLATLYWCLLYKYSFILSFFCCALLHIPFSFVFENFLLRTHTNTVQMSDIARFGCKQWAQRQNCVADCFAHVQTHIFIDILWHNHIISFFKKGAFTLTHRYRFEETKLERRTTNKIQYCLFLFIKISTLTIEIIIDFWLVWWFVFPCFSSNT